MIIVGAFKALFYEIKYKCDPVSLGKGSPSRRTIDQAELNLNTDCLMKINEEINDDGAKKVDIITNHGHQGGQDHFFIMI